MSEQNNLLFQTQLACGTITPEPTISDGSDSSPVILRLPNLDNQIQDTADISKGETDMSKRIKQRVIINGKQEWISGNTQQELFDAYLSKALHSGIVSLPGQETALEPEYNFEKRAKTWFELYKVGKVRPTTLSGYESYLRSHILPYFGEKDIRKISIDDVQTFLNTKAALSKKTIEEILLTLGMIFEAAKEDGIININPAKSKRLRNPSKKKSVRVPLTSEEAADVEAHIPDIPNLIDRRYVALLFYCPVRCEDIRGLRIKDLDLDHRLIHVTSCVTYAKSHRIVGEPKTEAGYRTMIMLPRLYELLELSDEELKDPDAYLIHMKHDPHEPLTFQANRKLWERVKSAINVYGKTPHCFRHTFATRAYRAGIPEKTLQSMGGWANVETLRNVYLHTQEEDLEIARQKLEAM